MKKEILYTENAPKAVGPYSQAVIVGNILYASGQIAFIPKTGEVINSNIKDATRQTIENIKNLLSAKGIDLKNVIKTTIFLKNIADYNEMNEVYSEYFSENAPARTAVEVSNLPKDALIEIEVIAHL